MIAFTARIEPHFSVVDASPVMALEACPEQRWATAPVIAPELRTDLRVISPHDFACFAYELYMAGELNWEEYLLTGFPSEMHPRFNETIGALTGEYATPNAPKDMLSAWEDRVDFLSRYQPNADRTETVQRVLGVLSRYHTHLGIEGVDL